MDFTLTPEQTELQGSIREFTAKKLIPLAHEIDESEEFPKELFKEMGQLGYFGLTIPEEYGGMGLDFMSASLVAEELSKGSAGVTLSFAAHAFLCTYNLYAFADETQRRKYLPKLISGEWIWAFALTEPGSGSDSTNLATTATLKGDAYVLNGSKMFITNGSVAQVFLVFARTPRKPGSQGVSLFIVERGSPGLSVGKDIPKLGTRGSPLNEVSFNECSVPVASLVGKEGRGISHMLRALDVERTLLSGIAIGAAQAAFDYALDYSKKRRQFDAPICSFQLVQEMLAQMAMEIEAARLLVRQSAWRLDNKMDINRHASFAKLFGAQMIMRVTQMAMQVFGGYGFCREFPVERFYRDAALMGLGGGTNEIQKLIIARDLIKSKVK